MANKIFLIEDEQSLCTAASLNLQNEDFDVVSAQDCGSTLGSYGSNQDISGIVIEPAGLYYRASCPDDECGKHIDKWMYGLCLLDRLQEQYGKLPPVLVFSIFSENGKASKDFHSRSYISAFVIKPDFDLMKAKARELFS